MQGVGAILKVKHRQWSGGGVCSQYDCHCHCQQLPAHMFTACLAAIPHNNPPPSPTTQWKVTLTPVSCFPMVSSPGQKLSLTNVHACDCTSDLFSGTQVKQVLQLATQSLQYLLSCFRAGDVSRQEQKMRSDLARFKQQVLSQRDASALQLRRLQQAMPAADSTSEAATVLSASTASSKSLSLHGVYRL